MEIFIVSLTVPIGKYSVQKYEYCVIHMKPPRPPHRTESGEYINCLVPAENKEQAKILAIQNIKVQIGCFRPFITPDVPNGGVWGKNDPELGGEDPEISFKRKKEEMEILKKKLPN